MGSDISIQAKPSRVLRALKLLVVALTLLPAALLSALIVLGLLSYATGPGGILTDSWEPTLAGLVYGIVALAALVSALSRD